MAGESGTGATALLTVWSGLGRWVLPEITPPRPVVWWSPIGSCTRHDLAPCFSPSLCLSLSLSPCLYPSLLCSGGASARQGRVPCKSRHWASGRVSVLSLPPLLARSLPELTYLPVSHLTDGTHQMSWGFLSHERGVPRSSVCLFY